MPQSPSIASSPSGVLAGLRVVELAGLGPVPFAGMLLADMGAEIVRIDRHGAERPGLEVVDRGRRIVAADLKDPADLDIVMSLLQGADVLLEGFRPGVLERLGLGPELLLARNPRLVVGRMTGWGQTGPLAGAAGHDLNYVALTGALAAIGPRAAPVPPLNLVGDYGGGALYLAMGVLAAVLSARQTGRGQVVDCAMCEGALSLMSVFYQMAATGDWRTERAANVIDGGAHFYGVYACADGRFVTVGAIEPKFYALLLRELGLSDDPAFADQDDPAGWPRLRERLAALFATRTRAEWCRLLEGTDACFAPVLDLEEAPHHPHLTERGSFATVDGIPVPGPAPRFLGTPSHIRSSRREASLRDVAAEWSPRGGEVTGRSGTRP